MKPKKRFTMPTPGEEPIQIGGIVDVDEPILKSRRLFIVVVMRPVYLGNPSTRVRLDNPIDWIGTTEDACAWAVAQCELAMNTGPVVWAGEVRSAWEVSDA